MWGTYPEFLEDLTLNFDNPTARDEARTKFRRIHQNSTEKASKYVVRVKELNLVTDFKANEVWQYMWDGLKGGIQDYMMTERLSHGKWNPSRNIQACYNVIHDAGLRVEERAATKFIAQKYREVLFALSKSKGGKADSGTGASNSSKPSTCLIPLENFEFC